MQIKKLFTLIIALGLSSCVSSKKYTDLLGSQKLVKRENLQLKRQLEGVKRISQNTQNETKTINLRYDSLSVKHDSIAGASQKQIEVLSSQIYYLQDSLKSLTNKLAEQDTSLQEKSTKVKQLRWVLNKRNKQLKQIKNSINYSLKTLKKRGLKFNTQHGKIVISLPNKLLFKSGSTELESKALPTIKKVADILKKNSELDIRIEGHTDNAGVLTGSPYKDNWELSVLRAAEIVRVLESNSVSAKRMIVSGRGEHNPIASNKNTSGKAKNRRIEIILSPNLDAVYKLLDKK